MAGTCPAIPTRIDRGSRVDSAYRHGFIVIYEIVIDEIETRVNQFASQQRSWRFVVKLDVMERVGENFCGPNQACLHVFDDEELPHAKHKAAERNDEPNLRNVTHQLHG